MSRPVNPVLFASLDPPRLAGTRCVSCGTTTFPVQDGCPSCASTDVESVALAERGTLWTATVQSLEPKAPYRRGGGEFVPFAVGYVHLGDVIVESRLVGDQTALQLDAPMVLTLLPVWDDADGESVVTYAFSPETAGSVAVAGGAS